MTNSTDHLTKTFLEEIKRRLFDENIVRLKKCLNELDDAQIWYRPNEHSNSLGNLVLHLHGNVRQWVIAGLGENPDIRERQKEFDERGPVSVEEMLSTTDQLVEEVKEVLATVTAEKLVKIHHVQGFKESGLSILVHVTEHFSYHVGQMTYIVKMLKDMDMAYYEGQNLNAK